ncbi:bifunctional 5,10-methylenetetrahydrofolate dehydrogenase/5,10-methenyltetrahydrofolate cyclohydrolase [Xylocopilactobacillus apicola]|uniref:Bifunctional protein FolD n=1 Tax=Xylocopilactobacillus apicola TaxID=2932184 RepID=A0AAU9D759_9LACO|nr:tetrahydrofolate dehydrogenase/cyclohydrolase catalytic domain-containing protein [Xylocopilactobacillus apicola]BDR58145.1 bifunctional protein FolD [Xylocopilactobacillus apicola]
MTAIILDGLGLANELALELKQEVNSLKVIPVLKVILVGNDPESQIYVRSKEKRAREIGINLEVVSLPETIEEREILDLIDRFNKQDEVDGIMVQLPLPQHISYHNIINALDPTKDADGFSAVNMGKLWLNEPNFIAPATPKGIMTLLDHYHLELAGKNSVIIGRSNIVSKPLASLLLARNSTVTITHRQTTNIIEIARQADFLFVATGQAEMVDKSFVKPGAVVVDVGINRTDHGLVGDVNFSEVKQVAGYLTPVPKGVGPMTVISLMEQVVSHAKMREENGAKSD